MKTRMILMLLMAFMCWSLAAQTPAIGGFNVYYGSLHNHCNHSDGVGTADQAYNYARYTAGLDFFSLADHSESVNATEWAATKTAANAYNLDGVFTAFWGFEWSHITQGHVAVINSDDYCASNQTATNTFTNLLGWLSTRECIAFFNHPGRQNSTGVEFNHFTNTPSDKFVGMELWNKNVKFNQYYYTDGYYANDGNLSWYDEALVRGWKTGASGAEDNHTGDWGTRTDNRMAILANNLTRTDLYNAMKEKRFFTTTDKNIALSFKINGSEMGSTIISGYHNLLIQATDADAELFTRVDLLKNGQVIQTWLPNQISIILTQAVSVLDGDYYYIRVKQADGDEAISSPIHISGSANLFPVVSVISPINGTSVDDGTVVTIAAAASDPDGSVTSVEFFIDGVSIGTDYSAPFTIDWTIGTGMFAITAAATDNQNAVTSSAPVTITGTPVNFEVILTYDTFEYGWGNWTSGGIDCFITNSATYAYLGTKSVNIQDNSGIASSFCHSYGIDVTPYNQIRIEFWYYPLGMEAKEDFWLEYYNGTSWSVLQSWVSKKDFNKSQHYFVSLTISNQQFTFPTNMKLRFMCDASDDTDDIFIDEVKVTGIAGGSNNKMAQAGQNALEAIDFNLYVYPNPASNQSVVIKPTGFSGKSTIRLMDLNGRVCASQQSEESAETTFDTASLKRGIYLVVIQNNETTLTRKLIIR